MAVDPSSRALPEHVEPAAVETEEGSARTRLYEALLRVPGLNLASLAREARLPESVVRHHLQTLVRAGLATEGAQGGQLQYFPRREGSAGPRELVDRRDKPTLAALRRPVPLRVVVELLVRPSNRASMGELALAAAVSPSNTSYHVGKLEGLGIVLVANQGRQRIVTLAEPERVRELLVRFPPPRDLAQAFAELWTLARL